MSKLIKIKINNILGGIAPTKYLSQANQFHQAIGIDPEFPIDDTTAVKPSGVIRPVAYAQFSSSQVTAKPLFIITNPKNSLVYALLSNGRVISYTSSLGSETLVTSTPTACEGGAYYNDYIYMADTTDVSRYGPLSGSPSLTSNVWTGSTLGSLAALTNTTYPSLRNSGTYPQHVMFPHVDGKLYLLDFKSGIGYVHYIRTDATGTNNASTYDALDLPSGYYPTTGCSYGNDIAVGAVQTTSSTLYQGNSAVFFWDTVDTTFYRVVTIPGLLTALHNINGLVYAWAGSNSGNGGHVLYQYVGGDSFQVVKTIPEGFPPPHGAVDSVGSRVSWGSFITSPENSCVVYSYGTKDGTLPPALQCTARPSITANSTDGQVTALKYAVQGTFGKPSPLIGSKNDNTTSYVIDKLSTTYQSHTFRSQVFNLNTEFDIKSMRISLGAAVGANHTMTVKVYIDDESSSVLVDTINNTTYPNSERLITESPQGCAGKNNFFLELKSTGTALLPVLLPIELELEVKES